MYSARLSSTLDYVAASRHINPYSLGRLGPRFDRKETSMMSQQQACSHGILKTRKLMYLLMIALLLTACEMSDNPIPHQPKPPPARLSDLFDLTRPHQDDPVSY